MEEGKLEQIIQEFTECSTIQGQCMLEGNYKLGNKMVHRLNKLYSLFSSNLNNAQIAYQALLKSESFQTRTIAATDCLRLNILTEEALCVLKQSAKRKDILGLGPETALRTWRDKGRLDP